MQRENEPKKTYVRRFLHEMCNYEVSGSFINNGKEMYKKVCVTCRVAFLLIRPIVAVFHRSPVLRSPLSITGFYILFEQTINVIESFAFSPG